MNFLPKWLSNLVAKLNCFVNGHGPFHVLHVYETKTVARFFKGYRLEKLRVDDPHELVYEKQKRMCFKCGRVSVDVVPIGSQVIYQ